MSFVVLLFRAIYVCTWYCSVAPCCRILCNSVICAGTSLWSWWQYFSGAGVMFHSSALKSSIRDRYNAVMKAGFGRQQKSAAPPPSSSADGSPTSKDEKS